VFGFFRKGDCDDMGQSFYEVYAPDADEIVREHLVGGRVGAVLNKEEDGRVAHGRRDQVL
jgi:hypothetical protein